jgi:hypothetical protein
MMLGQGVDLAQGRLEGVFVEVREPRQLTLAPGLN